MVSQGKITFNTACMKKFKDVEYVEILLNSVENCIAVPFYPKEWKDSFGLPVKEHERVLETNLKEGYVKFSTTM